MILIRNVAIAETYDDIRSFIFLDMMSMIDILLTKVSNYHIRI